MLALNVISVVRKAFCEKLREYHFTHPPSSEGSRAQDGDRLDDRVRDGHRGCCGDCGNGGGLIEAEIEEGGE